MKVRLLPLLAHLGLLVWLVSLYIYLQAGLSISSVTAKLVVVLTPAGLCFIGLVTVWFSRINISMKLIYSISPVLILAGIGSYMVISDPTTINILGGVSVIGGIIYGIIVTDMISMLGKSEDPTE